MLKRICRLCGKEGILRAALINGNETYTLSHYCPVKAQKRKEKKARELADRIAWALQDPERRIGLPCGLQEAVGRKFPYKYNCDPFSPKSKEQVNHDNAFKCLWLAYIDFVRTNKKYPDKREEKKLFKEVLCS